MNYKELLKEARENLNGSCKVCKVCNGVACASEVPGMGGKDTGSAFIQNYKSLQDVKINMRVINTIPCPSLSFNTFKLSIKN